jgi:hypothetical protein
MVMGLQMKVADLNTPLRSNSQKLKSSEVLANQDKVRL